MTHRTDLHISHQNFLHPEKDWGPNSGQGDMGDISNEKIYTGEFWIRNSQDCRHKHHQIVPIKRESKDTFVFLKDFKLKMRDIENGQSQLLGYHNTRYGESQIVKEEFNERLGKLEKVAGEMKKMEKDLNVEIDEFNGLTWEIDVQNKRIEKLEKEKEEQNEKIEKLEKLVFNLINPPLKPKLINPFD